MTQNATQHNTTPTQHNNITKQCHHNTEPLQHNTITTQHHHKTMPSMEKKTPLQHIFEAIATLRQIKKIRTLQHPAFLKATLHEIKIFYEHYL